MSKSEIKFNPIRGKESIIAKQSVIDGNVYFATDTGKIFVDVQNQRNLMGGSGTSVIYTQADKIAIRTDGTYVINTSDLIVQNYMPRKDDLIINSDGRFFKVVSANETIIVCNLLAVSGTGTGQGPVGPDGVDKSITVNFINTVYKFVASSDYYVTFTATSEVDSELVVSYEVQTETATVETGSLQFRSGETISLNLGKNMSTEGTNAVHLKITGANSVEFTKSLFNIQKIDFAIEKVSGFSTTQIFDGDIEYPVKISGAIAKTIIAKKDGKVIYEQALGENVYETYTVPLKSKDLDACAVNTIEIYLVAGELPSNVLSVDLIYHPSNDPKDDRTYIMLVDAPAKCYSYETPRVTYWVYNTEDNLATNHIVCTINSIVDYEGDVTQGVNTPLMWDLCSLVPGENNICTISVNGEAYTFFVDCIASDKFEIFENSLMLNLNSTGRTNDTSLEKRLHWKYNNISAQLKDFNWLTNGWMLDNLERRCLRISNGASVEIPLKIFEAAIPTKDTGYTIEVEFKPYNLYSYELLTQSTVTIENEDNKEDEEVDIQRTFDASKAIIAYTTKASDNSDYGFCCGTQDAFFRMHDGKHVTVRYKDEEIITISFVVDVLSKHLLMYVNGIMSGMSSYLNTSELAAAANKLIINSNYCDIDLYAIRVYKTALNASVIIKNYIASTKDLILSDANSFVTNNIVALNDVAAYNEKYQDNTTIPYVIFETTAAPNILPFNKANADVICNIEFVNPALDASFSRRQINEETYKKNAPSFKAENVSLNVQGTSSQIYPRKNFKGKFKNAKNWVCTHADVQDKALSKFTIAPGIEEKTFTWKADYMDSSSCHNTGFVNFVQNVYWNHPLDYYAETAVSLSVNGDDGEYHKKYRTSLFGFPVMAFHRNKSTGVTEFIGIYNFNLDKSAPSVLGMDVTITKDGSEIDYTKICECWEMANNKLGRCSFRDPSFDDGYEFDDEGNVIGGCTTLGNDIEVRYHYDKDAIEGAWENRDKPLEDGGQLIGAKAAHDLLLGEDGQSGHYGNIRKLYKWIQDSYYAFDLNNPVDVEWIETILERPLIYDADGKLADEGYNAEIARRRAKFETEVHLHLNKEYCLIYFVLTELLLMYDSRGKNMMLASWGPTPTSENNYVWFPIFYDSDTQLGVNNSGVPSWEYNVEPTTGFNNNNSMAFSTPESLLWRGIADYYATDIQAIYKTLVSRGVLKTGELKKYYNFKNDNYWCMKGLLPASIFNANEYYKYIKPSESGYVIDVDSETQKPVYRKTNKYFYCLQGNRVTYRDQLLRNRFNYYDSKWQAGDYVSGGHGTGVAQWRFNSKSDIATSPELAYGAARELSIKPILDMYVSLWLDQDTSRPFFTKGGQITKIDLTELGFGATATQQIVNIPSYNNLLEIGNLSMLYPDQISYGSKTVRIDLGNNDPNYAPIKSLPTAHITGITEGVDAAKPLLKVYDITNYRNREQLQLTALDLTGSPKLEEFKALGTNITSVNFDGGVSLKKLYLPESIQAIDLREAVHLTNLEYTSILESDPEDPTKQKEKNVMYIKDFYNVETGEIKTNIGSIIMHGGALKLQSYDFLQKLSSARASETLKIDMKNVQWSPYTLLGEGAIYSDYFADTIKYAENDFTFSDYVYNTEDSDEENERRWNRLLTEKRIYTYDANLLAQAPVDFTLLNQYITDNGEHFKGQLSRYPTLTGEMFINNSINIDEEKIADYATYFPDLKLHVANVNASYRAQFVTVDSLTGIETLLYTYRYNKEQEFEIIPPESITPPTHYDFIGWKLNNEGDIITDFSVYRFEDCDEYKFVAQFVIHEYEVILMGGNVTQTLHIPYGSNIQESQITIIPYKNDDGSLAYNEVYAFKGWTLDSDYAGITVNPELINSIIVNLATMKITSDLVLYAVFIKDSVYNNVLSADYFNITRRSNYIEQDNNSKYNYNQPCASLTLKSSYKSKLKGKITVPSWVPDPQNLTQKIAVTHIGAQCFENCQNITHCFFENEKFSGNTIHLKVLGENSFNNCTQLQYLELPFSLRLIGTKACFNCCYLSLSQTDHDLIINNNIYQIDAQAFSLGEKPNNASPWVTNIELGGSIKTIGEKAFAYIDGRTLGTIQIGYKNDPTQLSNIGTQIFKTNFDQKYSQLNIYCSEEYRDIFENTHINNGDLEEYVASWTFVDP